MARKGLGKGLGAIFGEDVIKETEEQTAKAKEKISTGEKDSEKGRELMVKVSMIEPNKEQPRKDFNEEQLQELSESIDRKSVV